MILKKFDKNFLIKATVGVAVVISIIYITRGIASMLKKPPKQERPPIPVVTAIAEAKSVPLFIDAIGECSSIEQVKIVPQVSGQIVSANVKQGQRVNVGDVLFKIDPRKYESALKLAEANLVNANAKLKIDLAQLKRSKSLLPQNYISQQQYESYEAQVEQDRANVKSAEAQVMSASVDLEHCTIVSPINGLAGITSRVKTGAPSFIIDSGNIVTALNTAEPLVVIDDIDTLKVEFSVSEDYFYDLQEYFYKSGNGLEVNVMSLPVQSSHENGKIDGQDIDLASDIIDGVATLSFVENSINKSTGSIRLLAKMVNKDRRFWNGQSVRVRVILTTLKDAVLVPSEAIRLGQNGRYVFVIKDDGTADLRNVTIGQIHGDYTVIKDGVVAGEKVVKRGQLMLAPGAKVDAKPDTNIGIFNKDIEITKKSAEINPSNN